MNEKNQNVMYNGKEWFRDLAHRTPEEKKLQRQIHIVRTVHYFIPTFNSDNTYNQKDSEHWAHVSH